MCLVLLACGPEPRPPKPPEVSAVFPSLPLPPEPEFISKAGSAEALQITLFSPVATEIVTGYYRNLLSRGVWRLVSDTKSPDGSVVLYAEQHGVPIWIRIWPTSDQAGTMVELAGALLTKDSVPSRSGPAASSKRRD